MRVFTSTLCTIAALTTNNLLAQTEVRRYNATPDNNYGVLYQLPKTEVEVTATIRETTYTPGLFAPWAELYLSQAPELQPSTHYEIVHTDIRPIGVPDLGKQYLVSFDKKTIAPFVSLTNNGIIYGINTSQQPTNQVDLPIYTDTIPSRVLPSLPKEYSLATSQHKQAEILSNYLYEIRESLLGIITGSAEYLPKDGESMRLILEQLRGEERKALTLFLGDTTIRYNTYSWRIIPELEDMNARELSRFAPELGIIEEGNEGIPLLFDLTIEQRHDQLSEKEQKRLDKLEGVVYNVPGVGTARVRLGDKQTLATARIPLPQVGTVQALTKRMFNLSDGRSTAVYFDTTTGEVRSILNE
ncbi:MAG: DUF4831 family protein [Porphyromonadaceae bacterium]|nr:DUF4831 family protein [Porphyromonadaceae bacterium]